jgi:KDO2-lipid IV(A) lauroyltransferase
LLELVLWAATRSVALLSWRALAIVGAAIGYFAGSVLRIRRGAVEAAMARAGIADPRREARAMYASLGVGLMELLWLGGAKSARRERAVAQHAALDAELEEAILDAAARGPVVLAASHTANWELMGFALARVLATRGRKLAVVVKTQSVGVFDAFCTRLRRTSGLALIRPAGAVTAAKRALAAGDVVAMVIDQVPDRKRHGVSVPFLGALALADRAPFVLARATGATVLVIAASRDGRSERVHLLARMDAGAGGAGAAWAVGATRDATRALDTFVRERPSGWLWLHRRWRAPFEKAGRAAATGDQGAGSLVVTGHPG